MAKGAKEVAGWKREVVGELGEMLTSHPVVGVLDISGLPAAQLQRMKRSLMGQAEIKVVKKTLLSLALEGVAERDPKLAELARYMEGQPALILTGMSPFKLSGILKASKTTAPAKPGAPAPRDILIPAGETDLAPGPVVGELQRAGVKAKIMAGKVVVLEDCVVVKQGGVIPPEVAGVLSRLGIEPLELGLKLRAAYEAGMVYPAEVLTIDERVVAEQLKLGAASAVNLAVNISYPTGLTIRVMIARAAAEARNLALGACLPIAEVMPVLLARARVEMLGLATVILAKEERALDEEFKRVLVAAPAEQKPAGEKPKEEREKGEIAV